MKPFPGIFLLSILIAGPAFSYDLILKNGKTMHGKLIQEDAEKLILEDQSGLHITFKKANVDLEKTAEANKPKEEPTPPKGKSEESDKDVSAATPKKPGRVYTESDIHRLRDKSPMLKSNTPQEESEEEEESPSKAKGEEYWTGMNRKLYGQMKKAEADSKQAEQNCQILQNATIQTHVVVNEKGEVQDMKKSTEEACQQAEDLKSVYEEASATYDAFLQEARMEAVPPGWLNTD